MAFGRETIAWSMLRAKVLTSPAMWIDLFMRAFPSFEEKAEVVVWGNKKSKKRDLYFLALSVCFGRIKNRTLLSTVDFGIFPPAGAIYLEYDIHGKRVAVTIMNKYSGLSNIIGGVPRDGQVELIKGPEEDVYGGKWDFYALDRLKNIPLVGGIFPLPDPPTLADAGKLILTDSEFVDGKLVHEPEPPGDGVSRGTYIEQLVTQALSYPCGPPAAPPKPREPVLGVNALNATGKRPSLLRRLLPGYRPNLNAQQPR